MGLFSFFNKRQSSQGQEPMPAPQPVQEKVSTPMSEYNLTDSEYNQIVRLTMNEVANYFTIKEFKEGSIILEPDQEETVVSIHNVVVKCVNIANRTLWPEVVADHFEEAFIAHKNQKNLGEEDYESIKDKLSLRVYPAGFIHEHGDPSAFVTKTDLEGTYTVLMIDTPSAFMMVPNDDFLRWNKSTEEVFETAQRNVNKMPVETLREEVDFNGEPLTIFFIGNEDYAASHILDLAGNQPLMIGELGAIVTVPHKGLATVFRMEKPYDGDEIFLNIARHIQSTIHFVQSEHAKPGQPVSDNFYWYFEGSFSKISVSFENEAIMINPPKKLSDIILERINDKQ